jgi:hypothetical protein
MGVVSGTLQQVIQGLLSREHNSTYNASELRAALFVLVRYLEHAATHGKNSIDAYAMPSTAILTPENSPGKNNTASGSPSPGKNNTASGSPSGATRQIVEQVRVVEQVVSADVENESAPRQVPRKAHEAEQVVSAEVFQDVVPRLHVRGIEKIIPGEVIPKGSMGLPRNAHAPGGSETAATVGATAADGAASNSAISRVHYDFQHQDGYSPRDKDMPGNRAPGLPPPLPSPRGPVVTG